MEATFGAMRLDGPASTTEVWMERGKPLAERREEFERVFQTEDPWHFTTSGYEQLRHRVTLELVPRCGAALEVGCAEGVFTGMLATRADRVTAIDLAPTAIARASKRCSGLPNVSFILADLVTTEFGQRFGAVVATEILGYLEEWRMPGLLGKMARWLDEGGVLITNPAHGDLDSWLSRLEAAGLYVCDRRHVIEDDRECWVLAASRAPCRGESSLTTAPECCDCAAPTVSASDVIARARSDRSLNGGGVGGQATLAPSPAARGAAKLLIVNADDAGLCHSVNQAIIRALEGGLVTSASAMTVSPWFAELAQYALAHPWVDMGVHLTFTCEWKTYRWPPLAGPDAASLCAPDGAMWPTAGEAAAHARPEEVEAEGRVQIERFLRAGLVPTHLDSHMHVLYGSPDLREVLLRLAEAYALPVRMLPQSLLEELGAEGFRQEARRRGVWFPDELVLPPDGRPLATFWPERLGLMQEGVTEAFVHLGSGGEEILALTDGDERQEEMRLFGPDRALGEVVQALGVRLVSFRWLCDSRRAHADG
jgi:SAM-dependent methyltransferase